MATGGEFFWHPGGVERTERHSLGATVWMTGLSGSGKSTIAVAFEQALLARGRPAYVLDGDNLRHGLNADLGLSDADRAENIRRVGHVAALLADAGLVAIAPLVSPFARARAGVRSVHDAAGLPFFEVWVSTPVQECERRDTKGLYARYRRGELTGLTGLDAPYESPARPELVLPAHEIDVETAVARLLALVDPRG